MRWSPWAHASSGRRRHADAWACARRRSATIATGLASHVHRRSVMRWSDILASVALAGCVGPSYERPPAPVPRATRYQEAAAWKVATPADALPRGPWWTMFRQPELDALQAQL